MMQFIRYAPPYPQGDPFPANSDCCKAETGEGNGVTWACTRQIGHSGAHQACDSGRAMYASWSDSSTDGQGNA